MRKASTSSKESESGLADHPSLCTNAQNVCFTSFQDTDNEQLSTFAADSDCSDEREINPALVNEEVVCETCISSLSNSRSSRGEELNLGGNLSGNIAVQVKVMRTLLCQTVKVIVRSTLRR